MANRKTRLAIVTQDPANYGGVLRLVEYIYLRSKTAGLDPTVVHYARFESHPELHSSLFNLTRGELQLTPNIKEYEFRRMRSIALGARLPEWERNRVKANQLWKKTLDQFNAFILVTGSAHTGLALVELHKPFIAWVSSTVGMDRRERLQSSRGPASIVEKAGLKRILSAEQQVLEAATKVLAVSEDTRRHVQQLTKKTVEVWPYPIDTSHFVPARQIYTPQKPSFVFVGRANDPRKRIELFVQACKELHTIAPQLDFTATVVSSEFSLKEKPTFQIHHLSEVSDDNLIELYQSSTALLVTSEQEGLGIAAMEAMACGLPVISSRCGGPETFIVDSKTGFFVEDDPKAFANAMLQLASDERMRQSFGSESRHRIERDFSEQVWNAKFEEMLNNL